MCRAWGKSVGRSAYRILVEESEGKRPRERHSHRCVDIVEIDV